MKLTLKGVVLERKIKRHIEKNYIVIVNETGKGGRYVVESNPFPELENTDF